MKKPIMSKHPNLNELETLLNDFKNYYENLTASDMLSSLLINKSKDTKSK